MRQYSMQTIKRSVDMKSRLEEAILGQSSARSEMILRRKNSNQGVCCNVYWNDGGLSSVLNVICFML